MVMTVLPLLSIISGKHVCMIAILTGEIPELENSKTEVHSVASVLKSYFRELPEPLIPYDYFEVFLTAARCKLLLLHHLLVSIMNSWQYF